MPDLIKQRLEDEKKKKPVAGGNTISDPANRQGGTSSGGYSGQTVTMPTATPRKLPGGAKNPNAVQNPSVTVAQTIKPDANGNYSYSQMLGIAASSYQRDPEKSSQLLTSLRELEKDPSSMYYHPYNQATNQAVGALASLGVDVSNIDDEWFAANSYLKQYYRTTANTNNLSSSMTGKRASVEEKAAYYYNQLEMAEGNTRKAEQELDQLNKELGYWASQTDRNYSDEQILDRVDWSKYPTLVKMRESAAKGTPMELNRAINFSDDAMQAVLWSARNPDYNGNLEGAMANRALGLGNSYKADDRIAAKLDSQSSEYSPYSVGCTMDKERAYFGVPSFGKDWVEKNKYLLTEGSEEDRKNYIAVAEAEQTTLAAEKELTDLYAKLDRRLSRARNPKDAAKLLDSLLESGDYPTLVKMDKSIDRGYYTKDQSTMGLTRAVNYRKADMLAYINGKIAERPAQDELDYVDTVTRDAAGVKMTASAADDVDAVSGADAPAERETQPEAPAEDAANRDDPIGRYGKGNIDLDNRQVVRNADGTISTELSFSVNIDGKEVLLPTVIDGKIVSEDEAIRHYDETGEYLGKFDTVEEAEEYAEQLHNRQEAKYGEQYSAPEEEPVTPFNPLTEQEAEVIRQQDQALSEGLDLAEGMLTPAEQEYMDNAGSTMVGYVTDQLTRVLDGGTTAAKNMATAAMPAARQAHTDAVLGSLQGIYDYERNEENLNGLRYREAELQKALEGKEYVGMKRNDTEIFPMERDGRRFEAILTWDDWNKTYRLQGFDELTPGGDRFGVSDPEEWATFRESDELAQAIQDANDKAAKIEEQNRDGSFTEDELKAAQELRGIQLRIEDAEAYQDEHREEYEASRAQFDEDQTNFQVLGMMYQNLGMDTDELEKTEAVVGYLTQFHDYEATLWNGYNPTQMYADAIAAGEDKATVLAAAKQGDEELKQELETAQAVKQYLEGNEITVPSEYMTNLDRHIAKLERDHQDYEYFALSDRDDFAEMVKKGREMEYESRPQSVRLFGLLHDPMNDLSMDEYYAYQQNGEYDQRGPFGGHGLKGLTGGMNSLMSQDELDTYYYLLGSGDQQGALDYVHFMTDMTYGVLWTRNRERTEAEAQAMTDSGFGGFLASNALAVIMNPAASIAAAGLYAYNAVTGEELNPDHALLTFSHFRNATREESAKVIADEFGEGTWQQQIAQAGYEIVTNRADSAMNGFFFGGLFGGGASEGASFITKALSETGSALPMGINASMDAAAEAKRKGASDAQAYGVAAVTLFAETVTEGFSLENMREARMIGEEVSSGAVKEFLKNWLTNAGVSEMAGESLNDIIENFADEKIMGELSEHADRVWAYRLQGMDPDQAELAARGDELKSVLRTALISYISPGLDIVQTGAGRYEYYRNLTQQHQQAGDNRSMLEILRGEKKARKDLGEAGAALGGSESQDKLVSSYEILESAKKGSASAQTAAVSAMLNGVTEQRGIASRNIADAAAVRLGRIFGTETLTKTQELVTGAAVGKVDSGGLTQALQTAALSESSQAAKVMQSKAYQEATPDVKAKMLAATVEADAKNTNVTNEIMKSVRENRINAEMKAQIAAGGLNGARSAVADAQSASREARVAESQLEDRQEERKVAQDAITTANEAVQQNPQEGAAVMAEALNKLNSATAVEQEYAQKAETAQRKEAEARELANQILSEGLTQIRQEAEARVTEQEAQEAQAAADAEVLAQQQAIEAQAAQEAQEASDNALDADVDAFIADNYADATDEEKQHIRELFERNRNTESTPDVDRAKFLSQVSSKFGVKIVEADQTDLNANGYYDRETNTITLNKGATVGDALYFVLGHELTHMTEQAGEYNRLADAILRVAFGDGTSYQGILRDMQAGRTNSPLARMVEARRAQYEQATGQSYGNDYYLQEIVADNLGLMLRGDPSNPQRQQDLINRLVSDNPTTARKILDGIKGFLKKAVGMRGAWQTDMQNTVDLFTKALSNAQAKREAQQTGEAQTEQTAPATQQEAVQRATETGEAQPLPDAGGEETSADVMRGGTVALDTERLSLNSFNEAEQERTRAALLNLRDENGKRQYTPEQVKKYMKNALGIAAMIAKDRTRLDFVASDNPLMTFLKKNQDYGYTLDASTLCAKRLLYQGTFNYVQHAMPDEVFTPEDLIDLVNIMNEMGYETPCGICYVESRRRWLDTYANEFVGRITEDPESFIQKVFEKAPEEEKSALRARLSGVKPAIEDLTTTDGLEKLRKNDPYMYKAFVAAMNAKGSANPKVVQPRTEYKGEISKLTKKQIQKLKDIGGLRVQSFSDFETPHLLDMIQAVYDMAARGLTSQAYTKVPNFAWVFGNTGIKINLSLIGKGTGLDDNGNLVFDNKEGMNFDEAMKLRKRYSKNVGTILVGINDDHIVAAMGDPRIDFIIPFHKSGWSDKELQGISSLQYYKDYTDTQNERKLVKDENGNVIRNKDGSYKTVPAKESKLTNFEPVGAHKYWDFKLSGEQNARHYLEMCAKDGRIPKFNQFLVDNGDGSFSLPEGDDYRSKCIREGYWKTLIDFKMYDNKGVGADQQAVTPKINMTQARRVMNEYTLSRPSGNPDTKMVDMKSNNDVPVATTAAEEFIRRIREKRRGNNPTGPNDTLEATPEINVMDLPRNQFDEDETAPGVAANAFGAVQAPATLGNTPTTNTEEAAAQQQQQMAIDAETGESRRLSLNDLDSVFDEMSFAELQEALGIESEEEAHEVQTNAVKDLKNEFDPTIYNGRLFVKPETLDHWLSGSGFASSNPNYAQAYITSMNPADFLRMTSVTEEGQRRILDETKPLDKEKLSENAEGQPIQLLIDEEDGKVTGHEGRHRAVALARAGVTDMPVLLFDNGTKYTKRAKPQLTLKGQDFYDTVNGNELTFRDVIPLSTGNRDEITQRFTASEEDEANAAANDQQVLRYSLPAKDQEEETLRTQYQAAQQTELDLRNRKSQIEKSDEMKSWEDRMMAARGDELKAILAEYKQWETDSGYADIAKNYEAARKTTKDALKALDEYVEQRNVREEQEKIAASGLSEPDWRRKEAVKEFGYTTNVNEAGYMLPNGKMLNFTGEKGKHYGHRGQDHRAIGTIYASQEKQHTAAMNAFMNDGNIRLMPESPGIDVSNAIEPTSEQYSGIRSMIRSLANKEFFSVDFSDQDGRNIGTLEYEGRVHPDRVVNDIKTFFRTGEVPQQSGLDRFRYSLPQDAPYVAAVERGEMDQAQQMVEEAANSKGFDTREKAYHGTPMFGFTHFDMSNSQDEIFVAYNQKTAGTYTFGGDVRDIASTKDRQDVHEMDDATFLDAVKRYIRKIPEYGGHIVDAVKYVKQNKIQQSAIQMEYFMESALDNASWDQASEGSRQMLLNATKNMFGYSDVKALMESLRTAGTPKEYMQTYLDYLKRYTAENRFWKSNSATGNGATVETVLNYLLDFYGDFGDNEINADYGKFCARNIMETILGANKAKQGETLIALEGSGKNVAPYMKYYTRSSLEDRVDMERDIVGDSGIYQLYTRPGNQFVVDAQGALWREISVPEISDQPLKTRDIAEWARDHDYDSVRINNVLDSGGRSGNRSDGFGDIGIFFNPNDIKSADTVTRDNEGNVIPLSERFQDYNNDLRYQLPDDSVLERQIREYLAAGGSLSRRTTPPTNGLSTNVAPGDNGPGRRQFGTQTAQESDALHQEVKDYLYTHSQYTPESNQEQIDRAIDWVRSRASSDDPEGYRSAVDEVTSEGFDYRSADGQARMLTVIGMAALKEDINTEMRLADAFNRQGTDLGRALQSRKIFRMMTPVGRIEYFQRQVDKLNGEIGRRTGTTGIIHLDEGTINDIRSAETEEDFEKVRKAVAKKIGEQIPANWKDKLRSWRMLAMLGNPRTHIRNIIGNALFIPAVSIKNKMGAVAELTQGKGNRTKTLSPVLPKAIRDFARQDAVATRAALTGDAKYSEGDLIQQNRRQFKGLMQVLSDFNSNMLEGEDWFFLKGHYRRALGGWMQANGYTPEQMRSNPALLESGREYAIREAQKATYRDFNGLAQRLNQLTRNPQTTGQKVLAFGVEAVLPFKKTPANILKRGIEYSPVGIARSLTTDLRALHQYNQYQKGKLDTMPDGAISPNEFIDRLCSGLTGTGIMALGAFLGSLGAATCGLDDDDDEFEKLRGAQEYAINPGKAINSILHAKLLGEDVTFTMDWAAPMSMPIFVGAAIYEQFQQGGSVDLDGLINAFGNITEPVFNLSMLDGVNSLLDMFVAGDDTNATITQLGAKVASNYVSSYIPSALGAATRAFFDDTRRKAFVESGQGSGIMGTFRYAREQLENKLPGLSRTNIPYRDVWGNAESASLGERILENFVLPGYLNQYKDDPVVNELERIALPPKEPAKTLNIDKEKYVLTAEQWDTYKTVRGQTAYNMLQDLIQTPGYQIANDDEKRSKVNEVWDYANKTGQAAALPNARVDWSSIHKKQMITALDSEDYEGFATTVEALREDGVTDDTIRDKIRDTYRDQYKEAYRNEDNILMDSIYTKMKTAGFEDFTRKNDIITQWEKAVDKEQYGD